MRKNAITFKVNIQKLFARIALVRDRLMIVKFVGPKPPLQAMTMWLQTLNQELRGSSMTLCRNVGEDFSFLLAMTKIHHITP